MFQRGGFECGLLLATDPSIPIEDSLLSTHLAILLFERHWEADIAQASALSETCLQVKFQMCVAACSHKSLCLEVGSNMLVVLNC